MRDNKAPLPRRVVAAAVGAGTCALCLAAITLAPTASAAPGDADGRERVERSQTATKTAADAARASSPSQSPKSVRSRPERRTVPAVSRAPASAVRPDRIRNQPAPPLQIPLPAAAGTNTRTPTGTPAPTGKAVATPPAANPIGDFLDGVLLMVRRLLFNQVPTAVPVQAMTRPSGQIWGFVAGRDPEGETITYTLTGSPKSGTVTVNANGVYTYTPGPQFTGTDAFTVRIDNPGFNINLLDLFGPRHRDVTVTIKTSPGKPVGTVVDTFDGASGSAPDPALWGYHLGRWRDAGLQTYTDSPDNVRLDGQGNLVIEARKTPDGYTSTRLVTQDRLEMQYGTVEARIKMPAGQGIWPAFWMLGASYRPEDPAGWPECGEIDIMEVVNTGTEYTVALHGPQGETDYYGGAEVSGQFVGRQGLIAEAAPISDLSADFHDYWLMWREDQIVIGVDDTLLADFTPASLPPGGEWVFNQPMYGILQIAVGGPWPGPPDATTPWPATMLVDSFRYTPLP